MNYIFKIGNVDVETTEPDYPGNESETVKNQEPNQETNGCAYSAFGSARNQGKIDVEEKEMVYNAREM